MMLPSRHSRLRLAVVTAVAVICLATSAFAQQAAVTRAAEPAGAGKTKRDGGAGANLAVAPGSDPSDVAASTNQQTQLRQPTKEETDALLEGMRAYVNDSPEGLTVVRHPDGMLSLDLEGRYQNVTVAKIGADGHIATDCVVTVAEARKFLEAAKGAKAKAPVAPPKVKPGKNPALPAALEEK